MSNILSVCYASDDGFAHMLGTAVYSFLVNNKDIESINVYILDNGISNSNKQKISQIVLKFKRNCYFLDVSKQLSEVINSKAASYSGFSTYARIYIQRLIPNDVDKLLYIDADTLVLHSLKNIMNLEMSECVLAAVKDTVTEEYRQGLRMKPTDSYFNAGILYINMNKWRSQKVEERLLRLLPKVAPYGMNPDQDLINIALKGKIYTLPIKYNCMAIPLILKLKDVFKIFKLNAENYYDRNCVKKSLNNPYIIHFNSGFGSRPWMQESKHPCCDQWLKMHKEAYGTEFKRIEPIGKQKIIISLMNKCPYILTSFLYAVRVKINAKKVKQKYLKELEPQMFIEKS